MKSLIHCQASGLTSWRRYCLNFYALSLAINDFTCTSFCWPDEVIPWFILGIGQPMRDDVALMQRHLSLAEPIPRMIHTFEMADAILRNLAAFRALTLQTNSWFSCYRPLPTITVTSQPQVRGVSNHRQLNYLFNSLFNLFIQQLVNSDSNDKIKGPHYSTFHMLNPSLTAGLL